MTTSNEPRWNPEDLNIGYDGPLERCPFCGFDQVNPYEHTYALMFSFVCAGCGAKGPPRSSIKQAAAEWNDRRSYPH